MNPLILLLVAGGGLIWLSRKKAKPGDAPLARGWEIDPACAVAEVVDVDAARGDVDSFAMDHYDGPASSRDEIEERLFEYFSSFSQCAAAPPGSPRIVRLPTDDGPLDISVGDWADALWEQFEPALAGEPTADSNDFFGDTFVTGRHT